MCVYLVFMPVPSRSRHAIQEIRTTNHIAQDICLSNQNAIGHGAVANVPFVNGRLKQSMPYLIIVSR
jgi:hypothetical protein